MEGYFGCYFFYLRLQISSIIGVELGTMVYRSRTVILSPFLGGTPAGIPKSENLGHFTANISKTVSRKAVAPSGESAPSVWQVSINNRS